MFPLEFYISDIYSAKMGITYVSDAVLFLRYVGISLVRPTKRQNGVHCQQIISEILNRKE